MKSIRKINLWIVLGLALPLCALGIISMVHSKGQIFEVSASGFICKQCGLVEHRKTISVLGKSNHKISIEETTLHNVAFPGISHNDAHAGGFILYHNMVYLDLKNGYENTSSTNIWLIHGEPEGYAFHTDPVFAGAFKRLRSIDSEWLAWQWDNLQFGPPTLLLPFKTNHNETALVDLIREMDLRTRQPRDHGKFPLVTIQASFNKLP